MYVRQHAHTVIQKLLESFTFGLVEALAKFARWSAHRRHWVRELGLMSDIPRVWVTKSTNSCVWETNKWMKEGMNERKDFRSNVYLQRYDGTMDFFSTFRPPKVHPSHIVFVVSSRNRGHPSVVMVVFHRRARPPAPPPPLLDPQYWRADRMRLELLPCHMVG